MPPDVQVVGLTQICDTRQAMWGAEDPTDILSDDSQQSVCVMTLPSVV